MSRRCRPLLADVEQPFGPRRAMTVHERTDPATSESDAEVQESMDDAPINPLTGTAEPEYHLVVEDDPDAAEVADRSHRTEPADDLDEAPIDPETGLPEATLHLVGPDDPSTA
jgi:hypothetical protein